LGRERLRCVFSVSYLEKVKLAPTEYFSYCQGLAPERLRMFLTQLEEKGKIKILARDNMRKGLKTYMITQSGKETVQNYLYAGYKDIAEVLTSPKAEKDSEKFWNKIRGLYPTHNTE
jgi:DNA-binding PadR family transcriptional regulator